MAKSQVELKKTVIISSNFNLIKPGPKQVSMNKLNFVNS